MPIQKTKTKLEDGIRWKFQLNDSKVLIFKPHKPHLFKLLENNELKGYTKEQLNSFPIYEIIFTAKEPTNYFKCTIFNSKRKAFEAAKTFLRGY